MQDTEIQSETPQNKSAEIVQKFHPTSEVTFTYDEDRKIIHMRVKREVNMTNVEAKEYAIQEFGLENLRHTFTEEQNSELIVEGKRSKSLENVGGIGITGRNLTDIEEIIPGVTEELLTQTGKIIFLGNGLSTAPVEILEVQHGALPEVVVLDMFDYRKLLLDLQALKQSFFEEGMSFPADLSDYLLKCSQIVKEIDAGRVKAVEYSLGDGQLPEEAKGADLAINSYGPPNSTFHEQVSCLKVGGRLYNYSREIPTTSGVQVKPIVTDDGVVANIVTRIN